MNNFRVFLQFFILVNLIGCSSALKVEEVSILSSKINDIVITKGELRLSDVTTFEWDSVFIFPPYTPYNDVKNKIQCDWSELENTRIDSDDEFCLLLFKNKGILNRYLLHPRGKGDFSRIEQKVFGEKSAVFKVTEKKQSSSNWYYLDID
jgi:carotenoid cleavage dioxygenase-like enzyme